MNAQYTDLRDIAKHSNDGASAAGWNASTLHFEFTENFEAVISSARHLLFCPSSSRSSHGFFWFHEDENEADFRKTPPYLLLPANQPRKIRCLPGKFSCYIFDFEHHLLAPIDPSITPDDCNIVWGLNSTSWQFIQLALAELASDENYGDEMDHDLAQSLLVISARLFALPSFQGRSVDPSETVENAAAVIRKNVENRRQPLEGTKEITGLSERHLQRKFREEMGCSLQDFAANHRIGIAAKLLLQNSLALKSIAYELGYANPSHFTRSFKSATGMTPSAFRKEIRNSNGR